MVLVKAKVVFGYDALQDDELTLAVGDIVINVDRQDGGWWEGEVLGKRGVFPENFVEVIEEETAPSLPTARVTFDYHPAEPDELELQEGDIIQILKQEDEGWWEGICHGKQGAFPSNFVELIKSPASNDSTKGPALPGRPLPPKEPTANPDELINFDEKPMEEEEVKKAKPSGVMGFGISSADLFKTKLRPVSMTDESKKAPAKVEEQNKPTQKVPPLGKREMPLPPGAQKRDLPDGSATKRNAPAPPKEDSTSKQSLERYKALHDYVPENDDELALKQGDIVLVTDKDVCEGWWEGTSNNKSGVFPNNFVEPAPLQVEEIPKDKPVPRKPLLPPGGKAPALPARDEIATLPKASPPLSKKPALPEAKKPPMPEPSKPALPDLRKKPPPPAAKGKPVPPRPSDKPTGEDSMSKDSFKNKLSAQFGGGERARIPSIGKKPPPPQPNGFVRTSSIKKPVPVPNATPAPGSRPNSVPAPVPNKVELPVDTDQSKDEQAIDLDSTAPSPSLSHLNKSRPKGPGKALPAKYTQNKENEKPISEDKSEATETPPWKKEIAQKNKTKTTPSTATTTKTTTTTSEKNLQEVRLTIESSRMHTLAVPIRSIF
eukprot:Seg8645.1 transcript_id=Seg8645.1/GoldUCD/mRNA.D3Y31 product="SH3 domain-containing kinase-binding protein 1" protein_id=Seg8645.1/GoldUCD/D3Y31